LGIYDPISSTLTLQQCPPPVSVHRFVTSECLSASDRIIGEKNIVARNLLGETFGTKKQRQQIHAYEKNKVDTDALTGSNAMLNQIDSKLSTLSTPGNRCCLNPFVLFFLGEFVCSSFLSF